MDRQNKYENKYKRGESIYSFCSQMINVGEKERLNIYIPKQHADIHRQTQKDRYGQNNRKRVSERTRKSKRERSAHGGERERERKSESTRAHGARKIKRASEQAREIETIATFCGYPFVAAKKCIARGPRLYSF